MSEWYNTAMTPTILITGAGGYIGSVATSLFLKHGYRITALDNFSTGWREPLELLQDKYEKSKLRIIEADLTKYKDIFKVFDSEKHISGVVHFAASCSVDESMKDPQKYFTNNVIGSHNLLVAMLKHRINTIIYSSTCAVYGSAQYIPVDEKHPTAPSNPYGESKLATEREIEWYGKLAGLRYVILRYFNVCGATDDGVIGDSKKPSTLLVQNAVRAALGIASFALTCPKAATPDGTPIRDYINVEDLAQAHLLALEYLASGKQSATLNLGTGEGSSVLGVIQAVRKITGKQFSIHKTQPRQGEYPTMIASIAKAKKVLEWRPKHSLADSVSSLVLWYRKHPKGWEC